MKTVLPVGIRAVGAYAPPGVLTNFDLEKIVDTSDEWIRTRSGISVRHLAEPGTGSSEIALPAARLALERAGLTPEALDLLVVATVTPDQPIPSTACLLQQQLGAVNAAAYDINAACTGFIYALSSAMAQVATGQFRNALVVGAETLSRIVDYTDRTTCVLMGDAAGAVVLAPIPEGRGILATYLRADGNGKDLLMLPAGGSRLPASHATVDARQHYLRMSGNEVYKFAVRVIEEAILTAIERAGLTPDDITLVVPHQANIRIIDAAIKRIPIPADRWFCNLANYGNTSAASIPLALNEAYEAGRIQEGDTILIVGFGGGLTWGASVIRW